MTKAGETAARYEARQEAAGAMIVAVAVLALLALASWRQGWQLAGAHWWIWLVLAVPGVIFCADLWFGLQIQRTRGATLGLLGVIVLGNIVGLVVLVIGLVTTGQDELSGGQLLLTAAVIWIANGIVFGLVYWDLDDGGPFARARHARRAPDFQFPQDENPQLARAGWRPRIWDYLYIALTAGTAFSPTDAMPLTGRAKLVLGMQSTISLVLVVLVTARAVNVLG